MYRKQIGVNDYGSKEAKDPSLMQCGKAQRFSTTDSGYLPCHKFKIHCNVTDSSYVAMSRTESTLSCHGFEPQCHVMGLSYVVSAERTSRLVTYVISRKKKKRFIYS